MLKFEKFRYTVPDMERAIDECVVGKKAARNRGILKMRFLEGATYAEIAEAYQMSDVQITRIIQRYGDPILLMFVK